MGCHRGLLLLLNPLQSLQGPVAVIIECLVAGHALTQLHPAHVGHEQLRLVACCPLRLVKAAFRLGILHPHKGGHPQVVPRLRPSRTIELSRLQGLVGPLTAS